VRTSFKYLGVFIGIEEFRNKNWDGLVKKVCAWLSRWNWLLPQLSYRGRVPVCNNLVASSLWHKMMILEPPKKLVKEIQQRIVEIFLSGQHWLKAMRGKKEASGCLTTNRDLRFLRIQTSGLIYGVDVS